MGVDGEEMTFQFNDDTVVFEAGQGKLALGSMLFEHVLTQEELSVCIS